MHKYGYEVIDNGKHIVVTKAGQVLIAINKDLLKHDKLERWRLLRLVKEISYDSHQIS